ncbi:Zinc finger C2HC domain-containing protein 1C [Bagarius yarrelli]|uniref:Zinc finger C2HC domain-containing protein 1C n=1 Tax=Bagarius yarrelli TaxID=175774 RepID=A0A556U533_BAGYA|nr:Zinc finger C2HC domain-containing protein 1C [Bagarius yarrelli]
MEKLPLLRREGFGYILPSPFRVQEDKERKEGAIKSYKPDIFLQMRQNSATAMQDINSEGNQNVSMGRAKMDIILNPQSSIILNPHKPKPGCHKMPFDPNNYHTDYDYFRQKDKNSLDSLKEHLKNSEQTVNRRQEKYNERKLEHYDTNFSDRPRERCEVDSKLLNGYKISHKGRLYENEIRMTKEIHKKEILLQEKLLKAVETLGKVQIGSESKDKKKEEQRNTRRSEIRLYDTEKGNWDWKNDRILRGRRHEREECNLLKEKNDIKRKENVVRDTNVHQKEKRNIQRPTRTAESEFDYFEQMTRQMRKTEQTEKDRRKERAVEWHGSEKWDQSDWLEKETLKAYDGERKRRERASLKKHTDKEDKDQRWSKTENALNPPIKGKDVFNHDKWNLLMKNNLAAQDRTHHFKNRAAEEKPFKQPLPNDASGIRNIESLQQVNLIPESSSDVTFQLLPCEVCHRKFREDRLEKHISICQKMQKPKCKVYDSSKHRIKGTEIEEFIKKNGRSKTPENRIGLEKLPPLRKEGFSHQLHTLPSLFRLQKDKGSKGTAVKDGQEDISFYNNWQRDEINNKILKRLYENEILLAKEIRKKEILLQENIDKAVKTLRKVQVRTAFWDKVKDQQSTREAENYLCYTKKENCDWESKTDRTGGRKHERQQEKFNNLFREDGVEKQKNSVKDTNASHKVTKREKTTWEYKGRNTQRTIKIMEKECECPEKMTLHTRKREQTEKNKARREKAVEWQDNEIREWDQKTEKNAMVRVFDGEKRRHKQTDRPNTCSSPSLKLPPINSPQSQARGTVRKEMLEGNDPEPLPNDASGSRNIESLQQVNRIPESSSNPNFQLLPCEVCHRKFREDRLEKHISICQKMQKPKCKVYDSSKHRIKGTEIEEFIKKNGRSKTPEARAPANRSLKPKKDPYSDYVTCPHCTRRFAPGTAEKHVQKCQNIRNRPPPPRHRHEK